MDFLNLAYNSVYVTYKSQSTGTTYATCSAGSPIVLSTMTIVTRPACGIPAAPIAAAVAVMLVKKLNLDL